MINHDTDLAAMVPAILQAAALPGSGKIEREKGGIANHVYRADQSYIVRIGSGSGTNIFVGDDETSSNQSEPTIATDSLGYPYITWTDNRNGQNDIYYAGAMYSDPTPLVTEVVTASQGATIGTTPEEITTIDDVSVTIPADALPSDTTISISSIQNPSAVAGSWVLGAYEFSPSGIEFSTPVTIVIPYEPAGYDEVTGAARWLNPLTGLLSQEGITDVEIIEISPTLKAISFKTTHFTQFFVGEIGSSSDTGGGCSVVGNGQGTPAEFILPYLVLAVVVVVIKRRDALKRRKRREAVS